MEKQNALLRGADWVRRALQTLARHRYTTLAGTLVFFLVLSVVPFLFWLSLLFGGILDSAESILALQIFDWAKDVLLFLERNAGEGTAGVNALFLLTTLWSSSSFFYHLRRSGEIIYGYSNPRHGWKVRLYAFAITFCVLLFFAAGAALLLGVIVLCRYVRAVIAYPAVYALVLVVGFFAAWILNAYICPYRVSAGDTAAGSALTALAWLVASAVFAVYVRFSGAERLYGALSLVVVFLVYLYWMMICFTAGAVFNCRHVCRRYFGEKPL